MMKKEAIVAQATSSPYVGPRPFEDNEAERKVFFGREREAQDLLSLVMAERLVLFFAPSGAGKSSLLRARLMPALREEGFAVLTPTRVGGQAAQGLNGQRVENIYVFNLLRDLDQGRTPPDDLARMTLSGYLTPPAGATPADRVLIVDQFEEIVASYPEQWTKREEFFRQLSQAMNDDPHLWVILAMREDYIAALDPYARLLSGRLRVRYRMSYMSYKAALEAVKGPAALAGRPFDDDAAERLVNNLRQLTTPEENPDAALGEYVEPVQLQVVCLQLWQSLQATQGDRIRLEDLKSLGGGAGLAAFVNNALAAFYEQKLAEVIAARPGLVSERQLRDWFSNVLITKDGTRNLIYQSETETGGLPNTVVLELERRFLLRAETRAGSKWIELVHDRFIDPILQANRTWRNQTPLVQAAEQWAMTKDANLLLREAQLLAAQQWLEQYPERFGTAEREFVSASAQAEQARRRAQEEERQRRAVRRAGWAIGGSLLIGAIMFILAALSYWNAQQAQLRSAELAETNMALATAEAVALAQANSAAAARTEAEVQAELAVSQASEARNALVVAESRNRIIHANQLSSNAILVLEARPQVSLLLAVEAINVQRDEGEASTPQAIQSLRDVLGQVGGIPLPGGPNTMLAAAMSADAQWLAVADDAGHLRVWNLADLAAEPMVLAGHTGPIWRVAFAPGRNLLASAGADGTVRLWDLDQPDDAARVMEGHAGDIYALAFAPDGAQLASGGVDTTIRLWDAATGAESAVLTGHSFDVNTLEYSPDGQRLASGSSDGSVRLWEVVNPDAEGAILQESGDIVNVIDFSPDGAWLASGSTDGRVGLWNIADPAAPVPSVDRHEFPVFALAFSPDSQWLASGDDNGTLRAAHLSPPNERHVLRGHNGNVRGLEFLNTPTGVWLASASYDGTVRLWDYDNPEVNPVVLRGHDNAVTLLASAGRGSTFATTSDDRTVRIWDASRPYAEPNALLFAEWPLGELVVGGNPERLIWAGVDQSATHVVDAASGQPLFQLEGHAFAVSGLALSPDGRTIATGGKGGTVRTWDSMDGTPALTLTGHAGPVYAVAFSPDGGIIASASDDTTVRLWDAHTGELLHVLEGHAGSVMGVAFSPDGTTVASADREPRPDGEGMPRVATVRLWEVASGRERHVLDGPVDGRGFLSLAYQPGGNWIAAGVEDSAVWIWDDAALAIGAAELRRRERGYEVNSVAFSPDGRVLASAGTDGLVQLLDTGLPSAATIQLSGHRGSVNAIAFHPTGTWLFTAGADRIIRRWLLPLDQVTEEACRAAGRNLTAEEWANFIPTKSYRATCPQFPLPEDVTESGSE
jgi:WD40 repeat protein